MIKYFIFFIVSYTYLFGAAWSSVTSDGIEIEYQSLNEYIDSENQKLENRYKNDINPIIKDIQKITNENNMILKQIQALEKDNLLNDKHKLFLLQKELHLLNLNINAVGEKKMNNYTASSATNLISSAVIFGLCAIVFATMPFLFIILRGIIKANQKSHNFSFINVIGIAYFVHFMSCIAFITVIKVMDILNGIYQKNYFEDKVFKIFWARGKSNVLALAGGSGTMQENGAYTTLYFIQTFFDFFILFLPIICIVLAITYAIMHLQKDGGLSLIT